MFDKVNLFGWTIGASGAYKKFTYSVGFNIRTGAADDVPIRDLLTGERITTPLDVKTVGLIYSLSYAF